MSRPSIPDASAHTRPFSAAPEVHVELAVGQQGALVTLPLDTLYARSRVVQAKADEQPQAKWHTFFSGFGSRAERIRIALPLATPAGADMYEACIQDPRGLTLQGAELQLQNALRLIDLFAVANALADSDAITSSCAALCAHLQNVSAPVAAGAIREISQRFFAAAFPAPQATPESPDDPNQAIAACCRALTTALTSMADREVIGQLKSSIRDQKDDIARLSCQLKGAQNIEAVTRAVKDRLEGDVQTLRDNIAGHDDTARAKAKELRELRAHVKAVKGYYDAQLRQSEGGGAGVGAEGAAAAAAAAAAADSATALLRDVHGAAAASPTARGRKRKQGADAPGGESAAVSESPTPSKRPVRVPKPAQPLPKQQKASAGKDAEAAGGVPKHPAPANPPSKMRKKPHPPAGPEQAPGRSSAAPTVSQPLATDRPGARRVPSDPLNAPVRSGAQRKGVAEAHAGVGWTSAGGGENSDASFSAESVPDEDEDEDKDEGEGEDEDANASGASGPAT